MPLAAKELTDNSTCYRTKTTRKLLKTEVLEVKVISVCTCIVDIRSLRFFHVRWSTVATNPSQNSSYHHIFPRVTHNSTIRCGQSTLVSILLVVQIYDTHTHDGYRGLYSFLSWPLGRFKRCFTLEITDANGTRRSSRMVIHLSGNRV